MAIKLPCVCVYLEGASASPSRTCAARIIVSKFASVRAILCFCCHTLALLALAHLHTSRRARGRGCPSPTPSHCGARPPRCVRPSVRPSAVRPRSSRKNAALQVCNAAIRVAFAMRPVRALQSVRLRPHFAGLRCLCVLTTTAPQSGQNDAVAVRFTMT